MQDRFVVALILSLILPVATLPAQTVDARIPAWTGCYDIAVQDSAGRAQQRVTFRLDTMPAAGQRNRRNATIIAGADFFGGGAQSYRTAWRLTPGDTLDVSSVAVDAGFRFMLAKTGSDSLRGTVGQIGMGASAAPLQRIIARLRPACA